jgi:uncharacterized SAM-binding protein YcdF (DUF218 family)
VDTLFFLLSKIVWGLIRPETWIVLAFLTALMTLRRRSGIAAGVLWGALVFTVVLGFVPLGNLMLRGIETTWPADPPLTRVDGIIVLGGAEETGPAELSGQPELNGAGERMSAGVALALRFPEARLMFSGGSGALGDLGREGANADLARRFFLSLGIAPDRILLETRSRNTAENAEMSLVVADPQPGEVWVLVTSAWHMPRAMGSFAKAGWPEMVAWPVDHRGLVLSAEGFRWNLAENLMVLNIATKEWVGRIAYAVTGR